MKLRATTTVPKRLRRGVLIAMCFVLVAAGVTSTTLFNSKTYADKYDDQINALQSQINAYNAEVDNLSQQQQTIQGAISTFDAQIGSLQVQINLSQAKHDKLVAQIADTETQIQNNKDALGQVLADLYVNSQTTPLEMLASSKNISDYLDKQAFRSSMQDQLTSTIDQIQKLEAQLKQDKIDVDQTLSEQRQSQADLDSKRAEQQSLLSEVNNNEAYYQNMISNNQAQIAAARAYQAALRKTFSSGGGYTLVDSGSLGGYPWNSSNCPMLGYLSTGGSDGNGGDGYGYGCRQCASYVAWRIAKETGIYPQWGDAVNFTNAAINTFHSTDGVPQPGSIAVMDAAKAGQSHGHVAWVEAVDGSRVLVSQYNYDYGAGYGMYSEMWLSSGAFDHYVKIK